jgi:hypothetical protein
MEEMGPVPDWLLKWQWLHDEKALRHAVLF